MSWDPYLDLQSGVLRNRLGITDKAELAQAEAELTGYRLIELQLNPLPGRYDLAHLQAFHRHINGRTQRAFLAQLARDAGYRIRWAAMDAEVNVAASSAAHRGDNTLLRAMLEELVWAHGDAAPAPPQPRVPPEQ